MGKSTLGHLSICLLSVLLIGFIIGYGVNSSTPTNAEKVETQIVYLYIDKLEKVEEEKEEVEEQFVIPITEDEIDLLSRLVSAEARGESYEGMVAVANVVLNRLRSPKWKPDTIKEVIYEPKQFQPVSNGSIYSKPTEEAVKATMDALRGTIIVPEEVDCFANKKIDFSSWASPYTTIDNHKFWISK